jgi:hypothetical protein
VTDSPELDEFHRQVGSLTSHPVFKRITKRGTVNFQALTAANVETIVRSSEAGYYFLMAAAGLSSPW